MKTIEHKFVEFIPNEIEEGILYVSIKFKTTVHLCVCGCGNEVVTPLSPTDWTLKYNGRSISITPSIGNWNFECRSHYWIKNNKIEWSYSWSDKMVTDNRREDRKRKKEFYKEDKHEAINQASEEKMTLPIAEQNNVFRKIVLFIKNQFK